ncbi:MAG: RimK family alpha-L-glutamate ligase, partial [Mycobacteriales bacterium]
MQIALAGCASIDDPDEPPLIEALARAGVAAAGLPWNGDADWSAYDLVVVRSTWDYLDDYDGYLAWADSVPRLANPAAVLRWNTDKRYLGRLAAAGVPVVPTAYGWADLPGRYVVKPTVSAGARDTVRYGPGDEAAARAHVARLGERAMVQPYVDAVEVDAETSLIYLGGTFSHGAYKAAVLAGESAIGPGDVEIGPREPSAAERAVAERVLAAVDEPLLRAALDRLGVQADGAAWDSDADWSSYDLVVVRSTWDYVGRRSE